jgi:nucleotide-binding universal stress UspA family protein
MTILAATDFSACSRTASTLAVALARRQNVPLVLVHAVEPPPLDTWALPLNQEWELDLLTAAEEQVEAEADALRRTGLAVETRVQLGSAAGIILDAADDFAANLLVLGTHGRSGVARVVLGSVAEQVVRSSHGPVLVTPAEIPDLPRWQSGEPLRFTVACDDTASIEPALLWLRTAGRPLAGEVSLVRFYWPPQEGQRYGLEDPWLGNEGNPDLLRLLQRDLRHATRALAGAHDPPIVCRVASQESAAELDRQARRAGADAVVLSVHRHPHRAFLPLTPHAVLRAATLPVLCVPRGAQPEKADIPRFGSVLLATDLTDASRAAVLPAYGLLPGGGRVELFHLHEHATPAPYALETSPEAPLSADGRARIEASMRALIPAQAAQHGITTSVSVAQGPSVAKGILAAAERLDVDVIVLGSHGRSGLGRALLGSVAEEVARHSTRPVLIARARVSAGRPAGA